MCLSALRKIFKLDVFLSSREGTSFFRTSKHSFKCARLGCANTISNYKFNFPLDFRIFTSVLHVHNFARSRSILNLRQIIMQPNRKNAVFIPKIRRNRYSSTVKGHEFSVQGAGKLTGRPCSISEYALRAFNILKFSSLKIPCF